MATRTLVLDGELDDMDGIGVFNEEDWPAVYFRMFEPGDRDRYAKITLPRNMRPEVDALALQPGLTKRQRIRITVEVTD